MRKEDFQDWLDTIIDAGNANYIDVEVDGLGYYHVMFSGITDKTPEELLAEELLAEEAIRVEEETQKAIKACEDMLSEPFSVMSGTGVDTRGALYSDTADGLRLALRVLKGESI